MSFQDELKAKLAEYDSAKEERNALVGKEGDEVRGQVEAYDAKLETLAGEVRGLQARADEERAIEEARSALPKYTPRVRTEDRAKDANAELRNAVVSGGNHVIEAVEARALTGGTGQNYADANFADRVLGAVQDKTSVLRAGAFTFTTPTGNLLSAPTMDGFTPSKKAESTDLDVSGTSTPKQLGAYKYGGIVKVSNELVNDDAGNLVGVVSNKAAQLVRNTLNGALLTGDGSGDPQGALTGSSAGSSAAAASVTIADVYDLFYSLDQDAIDRAYWIMAGPTATAIRTADTDNVLWTASVAVDQPSLLLGRPVVIDSNMPAIGANNKSVLFGDFSNGYAVRFVRGVEVAASEHAYFGSDETGIRVTVRADGLVTDSALIKHLVHAAS